MTRFGPVTLIIFVVLVVSLPISGGDKPSSELPDLPWHLADVAIKFEQDFEITRDFSVDMQLFEDVETRDVNPIFIAPVANRFSGKIFYAGCISGDLMAQKHGGEPYTIDGPGYVYTRFGDLHPKSIRPASDTHELLAATEGGQSGLRRTHTTALSKGVHTLIFTRLKDDDDYAWADLSIKSDSSKKAVQVGAIRFPAKGFQFPQVLGLFVEICQTWDRKNDRWHQGNTHPYQNRVPELYCVVGNWRVDGVQVKPHSAMYIHRTDVPQQAEVVTVDQLPKITHEKLAKDLNTGTSICIHLSNKAITRNIEVSEMDMIDKDGASKRSTKVYKSILYQRK